MGLKIISKNSIIILLVFFLISACKTTKELNQPFDNFQYENALLWEISGNDLEESSYLYGTIHLIESDKFFWPTGTLTALDECEQIVFEVDLDDMFDVSSQLGLLTKAFMNDNKKLSDFYSEEDYSIVKNHFEKIGIPMFFLEKIKPMFLTVFASGDIDLGAGLGEQSSVKSYEMELYELTKDAGKSVEGLETMEYQISIFDSIPYQVQADMLIETIKSSNTEDDAFKEMENMYIDQDINRMVAAMNEEEAGIEGYEDLLLYQRNRNWIPVMAKKMSSGQVFFAVGAGHLGGEGGVIDLLKQAGYSLIPLSHQSKI